MTGGKPALRKGFREAIDAAREEAAKAGLKLEYTLTGRHPKIIVTDGKTIVSIPFPGSVSV